MSRTRPHLFVPLMAAVLALGFAPARAADSSALERVEISGQPLRVDVSRACPNLSADLGTALARSVYRQGIDADYQVRFDLKDGQISAVQALGGPMDYRLSVRTAMRQVECQDAQAQGQSQRFAFLLAIRGSEASRDAAERVAIRELPQPLIASAH